MMVGRFQALTLSAAVLFALGANAQDYVPGEILVRYKTDFRRDRVTMKDFYEKLNAVKVARLPGLFQDIEQITIPTDQPIDETIRALNQNPAVEIAERNEIIKLHSASTSDPTVVAPPAEIIPPVIDPRLDAMYNLRITQTFEAWNRSDGKKIIVADLDTGVDYNHEDLSFNIWRNPKPTVGDTVGFDFVHTDPFPYDDNGHGTHTGGIIAGVGGNGKGVAGIAPRASLMALKVFDFKAEGNIAYVLRAFDYAISHGAKIISNSWGGLQYHDPLMVEAIDRAEKKGVLVIFATGNDAVDIDQTPSYPASYHSKNMITVTATNFYDEMAEFSNYGKKTVDLGAPGVAILSSIPGDRYAFMDGTSMACPHVAGAAALVWANHPSWNYAAVKAAILRSTDPLPALRDKTVTGGRLNVRRALEQ